MKVIVFAQPVTAFIAAVVDDVVDAELVATQTFWSTDLVPVINNFKKTYPEINQVILYGNPQFTERFSVIIKNSIEDIPVVIYDSSKDI